MPEPGSAKIIVQMPDGKTQEYELGEQVLHIGRDPSCDIHIPSQFVSRRHAMITPVGDHWVIQDERSTNGLHINGRLISEPHPLVAGDRVRLGDSVLSYEQIVEEDPFATAVYGMTMVMAPPEAPKPLPTVQDSIELPRRLSRPAGTWTILFSDLVSNTRQLTRMGDVAGQRWLHEHNHMLRDEFERFDGLEDKYTGDGFLVTFASARRAVQCAVGIQRALCEYNKEHSEAEIHVRIGLHTGEILKEDDELFGSAVNLAHRVMEKADGDEILVSSLMYGLIQSTGEFPIVERGSFALKGFPQRQRLYEVQWQEEKQHTFSGG